MLAGSGRTGFSTVCITGMLHPKPPDIRLRTITANDATIVVYQPQAITWKEYRTLEVRMAVAVTRKGTQKPVLAALEASVDTHTDFDT